MLEISNYDNNNEVKKFTIHYTKEELDKIQYDFLQGLRKYFAKVNYNNNISRKNEVEIVPPTLITIELDQKEVYLIEMGRRHGNTPPLPKTTWAISLELDEMVSKTKGRHDTIDDFIRKVFEQWLEWKDTISFMEEAYTKQSPKQSQIVEGYVKQIRELKKQQLQLEMIIANH